MYNRKVIQKREKRKQDKKVTYKLEIGSLKAPLKKGKPVGTMVLYADGKKVRDIKVTVSHDIEASNYFELFLQSLKDIITGDIQF